MTGKRRKDRAAGQNANLNKRCLQNPYQTDHTALPGRVPAEPDPGIGRARGRFRDRNSGATGRSQGALCSNKSQKKPQFKTEPFRSASRDIAAPSWDRRVSGRSCDGKAAHGQGRGPVRQAEQKLLTKPVPNRSYGAPWLCPGGARSRNRPHQRSIPGSEQRSNGTQPGSALLQQKPEKNHN